MPKPKMREEDFKAFHLRMPKETWLYIKKSAMIAECSMTDVVVNCLEKQRRKIVNQLTVSDTDV